jgi:hypothetical protein
VVAVAVQAAMAMAMASARVIRPGDRERDGIREGMVPLSTRPESVRGARSPPRCLQSRRVG